MISPEALLERIQYADKHGDVATCNHYNFSPATLENHKQRYNQYVREGKIEDDGALTEPSEEEERLQLAHRYLDQIGLNCTLEEIKVIARGVKSRPPMFRRTCIDTKKSSVKFMALTDTHFGSVFSPTEMFDIAVETAHREGVDFVTHSGDVCDGLHSDAKRNNIHELTHLGFTSQAHLARDQFKKLNVPIYFITGNHDLWARETNGADLGLYLEEVVENAHYLGEHEGDLIIDGVVIRLVHGLKGASYAVSYHPQKIIESIVGGDKPNVMLFGHTHKSFFMPCRHIQAVSCGSIQKQSRWMRAKGLAAHTGFYIIEMEIGEKGVMSFMPRWYPFYE